MRKPFTVPASRSATWPRGREKLKERDAFQPPEKDVLGRRPGGAPVLCLNPTPDPRPAARGLNGSSRQRLARSRASARRPRKRVSYPLTPSVRLYRGRCNTAAGVVIAFANAVTPIFQSRRWRRTGLVTRQRVCLQRLSCSLHQQTSRLNFSVLPLGRGAGPAAR